jgi:hypothetical protein
MRHARRQIMGAIVSRNKKMYSMRDSGRRLECVWAVGLLTMPSSTARMRVSLPPASYTEKYDPPSSTSMPPFNTLLAASSGLLA